MIQMMNPTENHQFLQKNTTESQAEIVLDLENDADSLSSDAINSISQMYVYDHAGNRHKLSDIYAEFRTIFVFVRVLYKLLLLP